MESPKWEQYYHVRYVDKPKQNHTKATSPQVETAAKNSTVALPSRKAKEAKK